LCFNRKAGNGLDAKLDTKGLTDLSELLARLPPLGPTVAVILDKIGGLILSDIDERFAKEGPGWRSRKKFYAWPILTKSGHLRNSFVKKVYDTRVEVYSDLTVKGRKNWNLASLHHKGTKHMPARPIFVFNKDFKTDTYNTVMGEYTQQLTGKKRAGLEERLARRNDIRNYRR